MEAAEGSATASSTDSATCPASTAAFSSWLRSPVSTGTKQGRASSEG
ncbi:hypothetical protein SORBI_3008G186000 [Sorghum bicolor]|uniref:Uncharacterized protein n=1 Tax=Sorghum bicolor TaxID=4558 RepID=A0A1B6PEK5_SORBI|nr:hypothetical protein SORBI_3008G186000 [Sorghum bicolor]